MTQHNTRSHHYQCQLKDFSFRILKAFPEIRNESPRPRAVNERSLKKIRDFQPISRRISETMRARPKVTINYE